MLPINFIRHEQQQRAEQTLLPLAPKAVQKADGKTWCDMRIPVTAMHEYIVANDHGLNLLKDIYHLINLSDILKMCTSRRGTQGHIQSLI